VRGVLVGALLGLFAVGVAYGVLRLLPESTAPRFSAALMWIAHPVAVVIGAVTRTPLQQEGALLIHVVAIPVTFVLVGALAGGVIAATASASASATRRA
jgi:hypothetical protein